VLLRCSSRPPQPLHKIPADRFNDSALAAAAAAITPTSAPIDKSLQGAQAPPAAPQAPADAPQAVRMTCASRLGDQRVDCAADTSAGVILVRSIGTAPCLLGRTWGYDDKNVWVSDGCSGEFIVARALEQVPTTEKPKPFGHVPNAGFLLYSGDEGEIYFRLFSYARYLNQLNLDRDLCRRFRQHADGDTASGHAAAEFLCAVLGMVSDAEVPLLPVRLVSQHVTGRSGTSRRRRQSELHVQPLFHGWRGYYVVAVGAQHGRDSSRTGSVSTIG
jgi:hypothetical protein